MKKLILFCVLIGVSNYSLSATWVASGWVNISKLYPVNGGLAFNTPFADEALSTCDRGTRFILPATDANYDVKAGAFMAAFFANKRVYFRYDADQAATCAPVVNRFLVES